MWDTFVSPIRDHLPLWLLLLPMLGMALKTFARLLGHDVARRMMVVNLCLSSVLCLWLVVAYEPLKLASSEEQATLLEPLVRFQFRDDVMWVGESRTALLERTRRNGDQQVIEVPIRWGPDIRCAVGVDGISVWFVALSVLLVAVGTGVRGQGSEVRDSTAWLWLQASLVGTFIALDVVLFVVCWMNTSLAIAWLMGQGGDSQRHEVTPRLLQRCWLGGWLVALGLGGLVLALGWLTPFPNRPETPLHFSMPDLVTGIGHAGAAGENALIWASVSNWLFWLLVIGFTGPLWLAPFHRGFVAAVVSAPSGVAVVLVGIWLKVGVYGWLRFILPLFPEQLRQHADGFTTLLGLSSLFAAMLAFGARDWRSRIALATCSSVSLSLLGMTTQTLEGLIGGMLRLLSHGLTAGLLVWLLRREEPSHALEHSKSHLRTEPPGQARWGGLSLGLVRFTLFAWIGLPGLSGFVAEFVSPFGLFQHEFNAAALSLATSGLIAWMWVRAERDRLDESLEVWTRREMFIAAVLVVLNIGMGIAPQFVVDRVQPSLLRLLPMDRATSATLPVPSVVTEVR